MRTIYVTTRMVEEFNLEDDYILTLLKELCPIDIDIQNANSLEDIDEIDEIFCEIGDILSSTKSLPRKVIDSSVMGYTNYDEAYEYMKWGIH